MQTKVFKQVLVTVLALGGSGVSSIPSFAETQPTGAAVNRQAENVEQNIEQELNQLISAGLAEKQLSSSDQLMLGIEACQTGNYVLALEKLKPLADQGNALAQANLGKLYFEGHGVASSEQQALRLFQQAATQGLALGQYNLGVLYYQQGHSGKRASYTEAAKWFQLAADQGFAMAQYNLGVMYEAGDGVTQSDTEALKLYQLAANQALAAAQFNLGTFYELGKAVTQSESEAVKWYKKAAEQGQPEAIQRLTELR